MKPFWITFYSYKGGVGRSLALSNIAALLVKRGRRVVLIDFDLEAPGLDGFDEFHDIIGKPGVVEYTTQFRQVESAPDIEQFVHQCHLKDAPAGHLWIMPAGRKDASYNCARAKINWAEMYDNGMGMPFVENWKAAIANHFKPDYVLVDSRTGLTDVGGICTLHLPDLVVMLFGLNEQNIKGIAAVAKTVREADCGRIPQLHYVASPVPNMSAGKKDLVSFRLRAAKKEIGVDVESQIRYSSSAALHERLFTLERGDPPSSLVIDYQKLLERLIDYNRNGLDLVSREVETAIVESDADRMGKLLKVLQQSFSDRADGCFLMSRLFLAIKEREKAVDAAKKALSIDRAHGPTIDFLLKYYRNNGSLDDVLNLCKSALEEKERLSPDDLLTILTGMGAVALASSTPDPDIAVNAYQLALSAYQKKTLPCDRPLYLFFNAAESGRRASKSVDTQAWQKVIEIYAQYGEESNLPPINRANCLQAMHIAFAVTGNVQRAKQMLIKARDSAKLLGAVDEVFSVKSYSDVSAQVFLSENDEMLAALERGELWDGMKLTVSEPGMHNSDKD